MADVKFPRSRSRFVGASVIAVILCFFGWSVVAASEDDEGLAFPVSGDLVVPELLAPGAKQFFYVSSSMGDDAWSGGLEQPNAAGDDGPIASLERAIGLLDDAEPGTQVLLRRGDEWADNGPLVIGRARGTEAAPLVLGAFGEGAKPKITTVAPTALTIRSSDKGPTEHFWVQDIALCRAKPMKDQVGIFIGEGLYPDLPRDITLSGLDVEGHGTGVVMYGPSSLVHGCEISGNLNGHGLFAECADLTCKFNTFERNGFPPPDVVHHSLYFSKCDRLVFESNIVRDATDGIKSRRTNNGVFRHNRIEGILGIGLHLGGDMDGGSTACQIVGNVFKGNSVDVVIKSESGVQVVPVEDLVIANNIFEAGVDGFLANAYRVNVTGIPTKNVAVVNNLFHDISDAAVHMALPQGQDSLGGHLCSNNLIVRFEAGLDSKDLLVLDPEVTAENNVFCWSKKALEKLALTDLSNGDYRSTKRSKALIDRGVDVERVNSTDLLGIPRPLGKAFDIGPFEFVSGSRSGGRR